ncbi:unnamed protein product [Agarophyton chilense]|eukprot:gb/GEZJ01000779.1/.p2 GENE.gb/GEZJ01000779.1/~~gb/GEZJ01000779.1/.p2  ORF type:complete len:277 (+),score=52.88 gb/GEZJ01000779.1/:2257-3087(+)
MSESYSTPHTLSEVRDYVLRETKGVARSQDTVLLNVHHSNLKQTRLAEIRFNRHTSVAHVKQRLYLHTGTSAASMQLFLCADGGQLKRKLLDDTVTLADVAAVTGDSLLIVDDDPFSVSANGAIEDVSLVKKYEMSDQVYDNKQNTYRKFKQRMREKKPNWSMSTELRKKQPQFALDYADSQPSICVADRVLVSPGAKRGQVRFVGNALQGLPDGWWIGVCYDEPLGKNDGMVKGVRYFECDPNYGALVRPSAVQVGDFPPLDDFEVDDDDSEDEI